VEHKLHFFSKKIKCASTNTTEEGPNGKHSKDLIPKSKLKPLGGRRGERKNRKT
jgi:hypothetical protein